MRWAITPKGVGNQVGARAIENDWPLEGNETFSVGETEFKINPETLETSTLAEDGISLNPPG